MPVQFFERVPALTTTVIVDDVQASVPGGSDGER